jgi:toxin ParE1/3/4
MKIEFLPEAQMEFYDAAEFYEEREIGLGRRFRVEVSEACAAIQTQPLLWREREGGFRRVNCPVFPYYIAYFIRGNTVVIAAVAHGSRRPGYWRDRF